MSKTTSSEQDNKEGKEPASSDVEAVATTAPREIITPGMIAGHTMKLSRVRRTSLWTIEESIL